MSEKPARTLIATAKQVPSTMDREVQIGPKPNKLHLGLIFTNSGTTTSSKGPQRVVLRRVDPAEY